MYEYTAEYMLDVMKESLRRKKITPETYEDRLKDTYKRKPMPVDPAVKRHPNGKEV